MTNPQVFSVIGHPLGHTLSPFIHRRLFEAAGRHATYTARDLPPKQLETTLPALLQSVSGLNVTLPYKQRVLPFLDGLRGRAALYRSVNTIAVTPRGIFGYNTDAEGFLQALKAGGIPLRGRVAIVGSGGVARTFACEAALAGCEIIVAARRPEAGEELCRLIRQLAGEGNYRITTPEALTGEIDLLINATPVGMSPLTDASPVSERLLSHTAAVFDAIYNPQQTRLLQQAAAQGARTLGGMSMLVWQAALAQEIWVGAPCDTGCITRLVHEAEDFLAETPPSFPHSNS